MLNVGTAGPFDVRLHHATMSYTTQELQETGHRESGEYTLDTAKLMSDRSSIADDSASPKRKQQGKSVIVYVHFH